MLVHVCMRACVHVQVCVSSVRMSVHLSLCLERGKLMVKEPSSGRPVACVCPSHVAWGFPFQGRMVQPLEADCKKRRDKSCQEIVDKLLDLDTADSAAVKAYASLVAEHEKAISG
jgi:hypothetical protein